MPVRVDLEAFGEGGGSASSPEATSSTSVELIVGDVGAEPVFDERPLLPDFTEAASNPTRSSPATDMELRGVSVEGLPPGIFDLRDLNDRDEPWVSDLPNDGMEERAGPELREVVDAFPRGVDAPDPGLDDELPIVDACYPKIASRKVLSSNYVCCD